MCSWEGMGTEAEIGLFQGSGWASCPGYINLIQSLSLAEPMKYGE